MRDDSLIPYNVLPGSPVLRTLTLDRQINWFEESIQRWIFKPAKRLLETGDINVDYAVLAILNAVPELLAKCQGYEQAYQFETFVGKRPGISAYLYTKGIEYIFPHRGNNVFDDQELFNDLIYGKMRCGLAHFAFVGERILLSRGNGNFNSVVIDAIDVGHLPHMTYFPQPCLLTIDVPVWYSQMEERVDAYIRDLRNHDNDSLRLKFSERITKSDTPQNGEKSGCVCGPKRFCVNCAEAKFPATYIYGGVAQGA